MTSAAERDQFDEILEEVIESLPEEVAALLEQCPVIVEDEPTREVLAEFGITAKPGESDLCGVHTGTPLSEKGVFNPDAYPDAVCLFRGPILRLAGYRPRELKKQIRITLLHEIGHLFGFDEEKLQSLGYE